MNSGELPIRWVASAVASAPHPHGFCWSSAMALLSEIARRQRAHAGQQILAVGVLETSAVTCSLG